LDRFVEDRLLQHKERKVAFKDTLSKNKYLTFASLYEVQRKDANTEQTSKVKADRTILQRLIAAYEAGQLVDRSKILTHELFVVPMALAEVNGSKAILADVLTADVPCPDHTELTDLDTDPTLVTDGQAMIVVAGKPKAAKTFGEYADGFIETIFQRGQQFKRTMSFLTATMKPRSRLGPENDVGRTILLSEGPLTVRMNHFLPSGITSWPTQTTKQILHASCLSN